MQFVQRYLDSAKGVDCIGSEWMHIRFGGNIALRSKWKTVMVSQIESFRDGTSHYIQR